MFFNPILTQGGGGGNELSKPLLTRERQALWKQTLAQGYAVSEGCQKDKVHQYSILGVCMVAMTTEKFFCQK